MSVLTLPGFTRAATSTSGRPSCRRTRAEIQGPASNAATFAYEAITGQRTSSAICVRTTPTAQYGVRQRPFYDIGAYEYRILTPPEVTPFANGDGVIANLTGGTEKDIYSVGGVGGLNQFQSIQIHFTHNLDPNTINGGTVILEESGGDGIFGNGNSPLDRDINLAGKLSFNSTTNVLTISLARRGWCCPTTSTGSSSRGTART